MIRIGTPVLYIDNDDCEYTRFGRVERTSRRTGRDMARVHDKWFDCSHLQAARGSWSPFTDSSVR